MEAQEIIALIQAGLKNTASKYSIPARDIEVNIGKSFGMLGASLKLTLYNAKNVITENDKPVSISISELFNIDKLTEIPVKKFLMDKLNSLADANTVDRNAVNATVFTQDLEFTPALRLQSEKTVVKDKITVQELIQ